MIGKQVKFFQQLSQIQKQFFSRRTIIDLKEYRSKQSDQTLDNSQQQDVQQIQKNYKENYAASKLTFREQKDNSSQSNQQSQPQGSQQYQETRSKQLSATILRCSSDNELIKIFMKSPYPLESQHYAMIFYKFTDIIVFQKQLASQKRKYNRENEDEEKTKQENKYSLAEKKMFIKVLERIALNLEEMNPDSLNLLLKSLGRMKDDTKNKQIIIQLFNGIIELLEKDQNINLFSEIQLYYFIIYLNLLKKEINENKSAQKVVNLALGKLSPSLINLKKTQLLSLMNASINLELYEQKYHQKLIQAMLKRAVIMNSTDYTILFQYNSLYFKKLQFKQYNQKQEELKNELANRILHHMIKYKLRECSFKNLMKICGSIYRLNIKVEELKQFNAVIKGIVQQKLEEYMEINQKQFLKFTHPLLLNDGLCYLLSQPHLYRDHKQFFQTINRYFTQFNYFDFKNSLHFTSFLIECLNRHQQGNEEFQFKDPEICKNIVYSLKEALTKLNNNFNKVEFEDLEEIFEILLKIEESGDIKNQLHEADIKSLLSKSIKYICQITHKFRTPVIIKIGKLLKKLLLNNEKEALVFLKYLKRYTFRDDYNKYEIAVQMKEAKNFFQSLDQPINLEDLILEDKPEKSIDELDFTEDLESVQEQIYQQAAQKQEELIKIKQSKEEIQKQFAPLQVPSIQSLKSFGSEKYQHMMKYIEVFRKHASCINGLLLSQITFSDDNLKLKFLDIWRESEKCIDNNTISQLLTIDNINSIILSQNIYKINDMEYLKKSQQLNNLCEMRVQNQQQHLQNRKNPQIQKIIQQMKVKFESQIATIEECIIYENNLIDLAITLSNGDKFAFISSSKAFEISDLGHPFDSRDESINYSTELRRMLLEQNGFKQVFTLENRQSDFIFKQ